MRISSRFFFVVGALIFIATFARFLFLESSPRGFYIDEAAGATNIMCVQQSGAGELTGKWALFFPAFDQFTGAFHTAPYVYSGAAWITAFGHSIGSFRALTAFVSFLLIIGIFLLTEQLADRRAAYLATLAAAISPWIFQFARIAWDPPFYPMFLVWACYFFLRSNKYRDAMISGLLLALAAYSYPTARAHIPLFMPALIWWKHKNTKPQLPYYSAVAGAAVFVAIPLIINTLNGYLQARAAMLSVFGEYHLSQTYQSTFVGNGLITLAKNILAHLSPSYLFLKGDSNLRHGTGSFGILSWLDTLAVVAFVILCVQTLRRRASLRSSGAIALCLWGFFTAIVSASLTWEGIPHALRSIGGSPFVALTTGIILATALDQIRHITKIIIIAATAFMICFGYIYFAVYPERSALWFDEFVVLGAKASTTDQDWQNWFLQNRQYQATGRRYHYMHFKGGTCTPGEMEKYFKETQ